MAFISSSFVSSHSTARVRHAGIWFRLAAAYRLWRKQRRDCADLAAMGYRELQDIAFLMR